MIPQPDLALTVTVDEAVTILAQWVKDSHSEYFADLTKPNKTETFQASEAYRCYLTQAAAIIGWTDAIDIHGLHRLVETCLLRY